jgi:hypothetical protein
MPNEKDASQSRRAAGEAKELVVREQVPICLSLCEPVCAQSDYQVTISLFGVSAATITVKGVTRFEEC